jgi:predicted nucleotidyltransferase
MHNLEAILGELLPMLQAEFGDDLLGVLATGSHIHGKPGPTSDLDLHVLIADPRRQRRNIVLAGLEIEMFINPPFQVRRYFSERGVDEHMFTFGRSIYDPHGVVAGLQAEARQRWEAGPPLVAEHEHWRHRYMAADALRDLEDVEGDEASANMLIAHIVDLLLTSHYQLQGRWPAKPKRRLEDLERWDAPAAHMARAALSCQEPAGRHKALVALANHVLAPIGGLMPLEWSNTWEIVEA